MNEKKRCPWLDLTKPDYVEYHDTEWGVPVYDDKKFFEFLVLESAQAGLSWYTILKRRSGYRKAFAQFDVGEVAKFSEKKVEELMQEPSIIRNRLKIKATVSNAIAFMKIQAEYDSFSNYMWQLVKNKPMVNHPPTDLSDYRATSAQSEELSKDLKKRGFKFVGSTICYAKLQACGLVNDHSTDCFRRAEIISSYKITS